MDQWKPYIEWDLNGTGLLPADWEVQIVRTIDKCGDQVTLTGASDLSREAEKNYLINVIVVTGDACAAELPWLRRLYEGELLEFVSRTLSKRYSHANDLRSSININCLRGIGARYEAHVDTNPLTGLLFACSANNVTGGELVFDNADGKICRVQPRPGVFIAFDARTTQHYVSPLRVAMDRVSLPMNYYDHPDMQFRPDGLDDYLYRKHSA